MIDWRCEKSISWFSIVGCYDEPYPGSRVTERAELLTAVIAGPVNLTLGIDCHLLAV